MRLIILLFLLEQSFSLLVYSQNNNNQEKQFVIIIPSYNNQEWVERNLDSVFQQNYCNFRVIYIDDCSTDQTADRVAAYCEKNNLKNVLKLQKNTSRQGALANIYFTVHECNNTDIIICVDGDDWLSGPDVLATVNSYYINSKVWLTFGQYSIYPEGSLGICCPYTQETMQNSSYRSVSWRASHLRTFYAGLFKKIKLQDLLYNGKFFPVAWDLAFMYPMLEMSGGNFAYIPECLYIYNRSNPLNDYKIHEQEQVMLDMYIKSKPAYTVINSFNSEKIVHKADILIFSHDNPKALSRFLYSVKKFCKNIGTIIVLYTPTYYIFKPSTRSLKEEYTRIKKLNPDTYFINYELYNFPENFNKALAACSHDYCFVAYDTACLTRTIDLEHCARLMAKTNAYGFYCGFDTATIAQEYIHKLSESIVAWQLKSTPNLCLQQNNFSMTLYSKETLKKLAQFQAINPESLEQLWSFAISTEHIGLTFKK